MALYLEVSESTFVHWVGERIDDILYPLHIENLWSVEDLRELNLYKPETADAVPEGKVVTGTSVQRIDGEVKYVYTLEDYVVPVPSVVTRRQAKLALHGAGLLSLVEPALQALSEPQKTAAIIEWEDATELHRDHGLINSLAVSLGLTSEQIDNLFIQAAQI